jgi:hypothetical protein
MGEGEGATYPTNHATGLNVSVRRGRYRRAGGTYTAVSVPEPTASPTKAETGWREEPWRRNLRLLSFSGPGKLTAQLCGACLPEC